MRFLYAQLWFAALLAVLVSGCRLPGNRGPVSQSLANCRLLSQKAVAALEDGRQQEAEALLAEAVRACPADPQARLYYGDALWMRGARQEAISQLQEAVRLAGEDATAWIRLAEMQLLAGEVHSARQSAEQALDVNPKLAAGWAIRGRVMRALGRTPQALADYHRALGYTPNDRQILREVALLHQESNRPQRALATFHILADTYSPGEEPQEVLYLSGLTQMALGRYESAAASLSAAARRAKPTPEIYYRLGEAELSAGRADAAATAARNALLLLPSHLPSRRLLERIDLAAEPRQQPRR